MRLILCFSQLLDLSIAAHVDSEMFDELIESGMVTRVYTKPCSDRV